MVTLRLLVDPALTVSPRGVAQYTIDIARALIAQAPRGCSVEGVVPALDEADRETLAARIPELELVHASPLGRRELHLAWQHGMTTRPLGGMVHSTTLVAPFTRHDRRATPGEQVVATVADASPWLFPRQGDAFQNLSRRMAVRARKHADAIVVPTHAVGEALDEHVGFGDRIRVIPGAASSRLIVPDEERVEEIAARLELPAEYVLVIGGLDERRGIPALFKAAALPTFPIVPVIHVGPSSSGERTFEQMAFESAAPEGSLRHLDPVSDEDLSVLLTRATVVVNPSLHDGMGQTAIEALSFGRPLVHSDDPSLEEIVAGAGVSVPRLDAAGYPERLAQAIAETIEDAELRRRLSIEGQDRADAFGWSDAADRIWQLHAEL